MKTGKTMQPGQINKLEKTIIYDCLISYPKNVPKDALVFLVQNDAPLIEDDTVTT